MEIYENGKLANARTERKGKTQQEWIGELLLKKTRSRILKKKRVKYITSKTLLLEDKNSWNHQNSRIKKIIRIMYLFTI